MSRWRGLPAWARWIALTAGLALGSAGLGLILRVGAGNGIFFGGMAALLTSLWYIRLGGPKTVVGRAIDGKPEWGVDADKRRAELRTGWFVFSIGAALWTLLIVAYVAGTTF